MKQFLLACLLAVVVLPSSAQLRKGQKAPAIKLPNEKDSSITLASFKGKVVLIDFWASWCGPCRRSNPKLVKLYKKYKDQGFEIIGISLDQNKSSWLEAVKKDKLAYTQLIDSSGEKAEAANAYGVYQIPTQYLIDKNGRLQEKDLEGSALETAIEKLLKEEES